jgi:MFS family permease
VGGHLADRVGRRESIAASMLSSATVMVALSQAGSLALILVLTALAGLTSEAYRPASSALLADLVPAGRRVTAFAAYRFAINLGFSAGPAVAGLLAERAYVLVFLGDAATSAVFGVMALVLLPATRAAAPPAPEHAKDPPSWRRQPQRRSCTSSRRRHCRCRCSPTATRPPYTGA